MPTVSQREPPATALRAWLRVLMVSDANAAALAVLAGAPVLLGIWALLSPGRILSREMTWDLLFIFSGAWHLHFGHVAHIDFHEPIAILNFLLPLPGFLLFGMTPLAFLVGVVIVAAAMFVVAFWAAWRRLPLVPACIFVVFVEFLVLMPAAVGDTLNASSFAMSYNRYGWSALCVLTLILFMPPRNGRAGDWLDVATTAFLLVALYYLKITYFVAGMAALGLAVLVSPHIRRRWKTWVAAGFLISANAVAPYNHPYIADMWNATHAGGVRSNPRFFLWTFLPGAAQHAPFAAALVVAGLMWWRGKVPLRLPAAMAFIIVMGLFIFSQNAEPDGLALGIMMAFLIYDQLRPRQSQEPVYARMTSMLALMVFPLFAVGASSVSLALYHFKAKSSEGMYVVDRTQLQGLVVPAGDSGLLAAFSRGQANPEMLNRLRKVGARNEISAFEYVETILEAAAILEEGRYPKGGIMVLDQINPLPFVLGIEPPRGENLWSSLDRPFRPAASLFAAADYVFIPKFSTDSAMTKKATAVYGPYLSSTYPYRRETPSWVMFSRSDAVPANKR